MRNRQVDGVFADTFTIEDVSRGVALVNAGYSWREAAQVVGMDTSGLRKRADRDGLTFRRGKRSFNKKLRVVIPTKPTDLAYLAGILDGEGNITIAEAPRNVVRVGIANTDLSLMRWLLSIGGSMSEKHCLATQKSKTICYYWQLHSRIDTRAFLRAIVPYMRIKRAKAELAIELISSWVTEQETSKAALEAGVTH